MATFAARGRHAWDVSPGLDQQYETQPQSVAPVYTAVLTYAKYTVSAAGRHDNAAGDQQYDVLPASVAPVYTASLNYAKYTHAARAAHQRRYGLLPSAPAGSGNRIPWAD